MIRLSRIAALCFVLMLVATPLFAAEGEVAVEEGTVVEEGAVVEEAVEEEAVEEEPLALITFSPAFGAALIIIGAGYGIGKIGSCAVESMARQPEVANNIQTAMLISAALIEGATFFALIVLIIT